jgi:hypothetical protein
MTHCIHVYELVGSPICPHCGKATHENDWEQQLNLRREYTKKVGIFYQAPLTWWSI